MASPDASETPSAEVLKGLFEASLQSNPDKLGFTDTESKNFSKAFEDPEFRKMFGEYMDELQDPKNREETEAYIRQLEGEQKVPDGKELIRPTAGFVAKTYKEDTKEKEGKGDKVWLNIVMSDSIAKPTAVRTDGGESWSVPYSLGPPHMEKDSGGENVATFDCCFHPEALSLAKGRQAFQSLLVQTAIEGVEEGFKRQNAPTKLLKDYHVLKNVVYKSGVISTMMVDKASKNSWKTGGGDSSQPQSQSQSQPQSSSVNKLAEQLVGGKVQAQAQAQTPVAVAGDKKQQRTKAEIAAAVAQAQKQQSASPKSPTAPTTASAASPVSPSGAGAKATTGEPLIKKGFLEGRGGSKPAPKAVNPLIQEISSSAVPTPKKPTTPRKTANSLAAAANAEAAAVANPPAVEEIKAAKPSTPRKTANSQAAAAAAAAAPPVIEETKAAKPSTPRKTANSQAAAAAAAAAPPVIEEVKAAKPSTPRKTANSQAAAASAAAAATTAGLAGGSNPPLPPSVTQEAQALAALSEAEVQSVSASAARSRAQHKDRPVDSSLLNTINKEQTAGAGAVADGAKKGPIEPKYSITERGLVELGDFELSSSNGGEGTSGNRVRSTRPKELVVRIELPRVAAGQTGQVELDVSEKRLSLKYKDVYAVSFSLPYRVDDKKGAAKFEKASQALVVTLPVAKPTEAEVEMQLKALSTPVAAQQSVVPDASADSAEVAKGRDEAQPSAAAKAGSPEKKMAAAGGSGGGGGGSKNPYLASVSAEEARAAADLKEEIARAAEAAQQQALREASNPNRIAAQEEAQRQRVAQAQRDAEANSTENAQAGSSAAFIPCEAFAGRKPGYVFKRSDVGLGYHLDVNPALASKKAAAAANGSASGANVAKTEAAAAPSATVAELPSFEYRQTSQAITVLVNVTNIDSASVHTSYAPSSVQCSFTAAGKAYAFELRVNEELKAEHKLDVQRCKHDVASRNMVMVLVKQSTCLLVWEVKDGAQLLNARPWVGKFASAVAASTSSAASASPTAAKQQAPVETTPNAIDALIQQAATMKFSSASAEALFDLD